MREPDLERDGWCLLDAEELHREAPRTFWLPELKDRQSLHPGDIVKLIFCISLGAGGENTAVERMWVIVRERVGDQYLGILDNNPHALEENEVLWSGVELPFAPRHVIDVYPQDPGDDLEPVKPPSRRWPRG